MIFHFLTRREHLCLKPHLKERRTLDMSLKNRENFNWTYAYDKPCTAKNGFFSVQFTFIVSLLGLLLFSYGFIFFTIQRQDAFHKLCLTEGLSLQKNILRQERMLFALNAQSTIYRLELQALYLELAATIEIPAAAIVIQKQIEAVQKLQEI